MCRSMHHMFSEDIDQTHTCLQAFSQKWAPPAKRLAKQYEKRCKIKIHKSKAGSIDCWLSSSVRKWRKVRSTSIISRNFNGIFSGHTELRNHLNCDISSSQWITSCKNKIPFFIWDLEKRITAIFSDLGNDGFAPEKQHYSKTQQLILLIILYNMYKV